MPKFEVNYRVEIEAEDWDEACALADEVQVSIFHINGVTSVDSGTTLEEV